MSRVIIRAVAFVCSCFAAVLLIELGLPPSNILIGGGLVFAGVLEFAAARDPRLYITAAVDSFRWCIGWGLSGLGGRLIWIEVFGDEAGVSLWSRICLSLIALGVVGVQLNNFHRTTPHVPKFLRRYLD